MTTTDYDDERVRIKCEYTQTRWDLEIVHFNKRCAVLRDCESESFLFYDRYTEAKTLIEAKYAPILSAMLAEAKESYLLLEASYIARCDTLDSEYFADESSLS